MTVTTVSAPGAGSGRPPIAGPQPTAEPVAGPADAASALNLRLNPCTRTVWRGVDELQLELDGRSVVVSGSAAHAVDALHRRPESFGSFLPTDLTGTPFPDVSAESAVGRVLGALVRAGFLTVWPPDPLPLGANREADVSVTAALIAPDVAALAARFGLRAADVVRLRRTRHVLVQGTGRLPTLIASLFAAAGIGHVSIGEGGEVALGDVLPGGLQPDDEGRRTGLAGHEAIRRAAPSVDTSGPGPGAADLTVLAVDSPVRSSAHRPLSARHQPHLVATVWAASAVIGPLVVPGRTSCLNCADLHRSDRDPAWPALAAQLATGPATQAPSDVALCVFAAALTVVQGLSFMDGERPATIDGTLETRLPDWRLRRRSWPSHPDCPCAWPAAPRHTGLRE